MGRLSLSPKMFAVPWVAVGFLLTAVLGDAASLPGRENGQVPKTSEAYATLLYGDEFLLGVRVLGKSLRNVGATKDMVVLVSQGVSAEAIDMLKAERWIVKRIGLVENPNDKRTRPARFWGVYTKLEVFNLTEYKKVVYLDADTIVIRPLEELFECSKFCANLKHSERLNSGVMVLEPSAELFQDMMSKVSTLYSYTGGDQGFLNTYYDDFPNAKLFDPTLSAEQRLATPAPKMERLSTFYNGDVGLYVLGNKWMFDETKLTVLHYTLGPLKPWDWWTAWLLKPVDQWQDIRMSLEETVPGAGGGLTYRITLTVRVLVFLPIFLLVCLYRRLLIQIFGGLWGGSCLSSVRQLWYRCKPGSNLMYSSLSVPPNHGTGGGSSVSGNTRVVPYLAFWSVCACFSIALLSLGFAFVIVPYQVTPWTGMLLLYEWTFFLFLVIYGIYLEAMYVLGRRSGPGVASSASGLASDKSSTKGHGGRQDHALWDMETTLYELGMAAIAVVIPSMPYICGVTALLPRVGLMVGVGMLLVAYITYAAQHLAIRWYYIGRDDWNRSRGISLCCDLI